MALPVQGVPQSLETTVQRDLKFQGDDSSALAVTAKVLAANSFLSSVADV